VNINFKVAITATYTRISGERMKQILKTNALVYPVMQRRKQNQPLKHCGIKTQNDGYVKRSVTKTATLHNITNRLTNFWTSFPLTNIFIMNPVLYKAANPQFSGLKKLTQHAARIVVILLPIRYPVMNGPFCEINLPMPTYKVCCQCSRVTRHLICTASSLHLPPLRF